MPWKAKDSVAVVTGASSGIGKCLTQQLADNGCHVIAIARRADRIHQWHASSPLSGFGGVTPIAGDITKREVRSTIRSTIETHHGGKLDLLVNNAAASPLSPFHEISPEVFETTINTNVRSLFYLTQAIWKKMREQGAGVIVNISSLSAVDPFDGLGFYGACKAWMDLMTQALAKEGSELGLRVCSIRPGAVETPMLRRLFPDFPSEQCVQPRAIAEAVWGCVAEPESYPSGEAFTVTDQS